MFLENEKKDGSRALVDTLLCCLRQCCGTVTIFYGTGSESSFWQFSVPAPVLVQALYQDHKKYSFPKCEWELLRFHFITVPEPIMVPVLVPLKSVIKLRFRYVKKLQFLRFRFQFSNTSPYVVLIRESGSVTKCHRFGTSRRGPGFSCYRRICVKGSVADPGCLSRIPDPVFYPSRIPDLGSKNSNKREGWKKICCHNFLCSYKFHKIANYFSFEVLKKKIWANFQKNFLPQMGLGSGIWDPGSGKTYSGSRIQGSKRHRIPDPDPQHWSKENISAALRMKSPLCS